MLNVERMTITLPADLASVIKGAVKGGSYASSSEVIREALRDWNIKNAPRLGAFASLKADIEKGFADAEAGRVHKFDAKKIIAMGRKKLKSRSN
jgi:antitoxin ParD1/3/4